MNPGVFSLIGIFALAAAFGTWRVVHGRSIERRLEAKGFEPCDAEAPALEAAWRTLTGADASQELHLVNCRRHAAGLGMLYHFTVREKPSGQDSDDETAAPGATYPAYLFNLRRPDVLPRGAITLHVLPPGSKALRALLASVIGLSESRPRLDVGIHPWSSTIVAAHGSTAGRLDDLVPVLLQEKLTRAAAHGFFILHLGHGKAAFAALSSHRDVDRQMSYLAEWV